MGERVVVSVVILIIVMFLVIFMIEMFIPLSANLDFRDICRNYLMKMEFNSGLSNADIGNLEQELQKNHFEDIQIIAPNTCKFGEEMELKIYVSYSMKTITALFTRTNKKFFMEYQRKVIARKVIN